MKWDRAFQRSARAAGNTSLQDYAWGNTTLPHEGKTMITKDLGGGGMRAHHLWWFSHLPHVHGETDGISNNWWEYAVDPNKV
jgi:hypothetical protein